MVLRAGFLIGVGVSFEAAFLLAERLGEEGGDENDLVGLREGDSDGDDEEGGDIGPLAFWFDLLTRGIVATGTVDAASMIPFCLFLNALSFSADVFCSGTSCNTVSPVLWPCCRASRTRFAFSAFADSAASTAAVAVATNLFTRACPRPSRATN